MVTHDLKSPLNGIIGFADLLTSILREKYPDPTALKAIEQISIAGNNIFSLVDNILSMAKIEAGKEQPEFAWVDNLKNAISSSLEVFEFQAQAKSIQMHLVAEDYVPRVYWDFNRIKLHVLNNILSNALRFTPKGGLIVTKLGYTGGWVTIQIQDSGPGLKTKDLNSVFNQYTTGQTPENIRSGDGHGYGLYNAKLFVESHNGRIFASNVEKSIGTGAVFTILLPVNAETDVLS